MANPEVNDSNKSQGNPFLDEVRRMDAPNGLDLHPQPRKVVRISRRASMVIIFVVVGLLLAFAYGGYRRTQRAQVAARDAGLPKNVSPATQASAEFTKSIPDGTAPLANRNTAGLQPPAAASPDKNLTPCGSNPQTGQPYRFNPQTGQPCDGLPQERLVVRQAPIAKAPQSVPVVTTHEETPEERRVAAAYAREQEARMAPTGIKSSVGTSSFGPLASNGRSGSDDLAQVAALTKAVGSSSVDLPSGDLSRSLTQTENEYDGQNMQTRKEVFLSAARTHQSDDYLRSARDVPLSMFEIKAGWEIPAVLEQSLNSDLPGELKALVMASVYDTATGQYLLIPQGSRLIGKYDSRVAYGQDGVQVTWSRIIFPDASSNRPKRDGWTRFARQRGAAGQSGQTLCADRGLLGIDKPFHGRFRNLTAAKPKRSCLSESGRGSFECCWPRAEPDGITDYSQELECATDNQGPCRLQVHGSCQPGHLV